MNPIDKAALFRQLTHLRLLKVYLEGEIAEAHKTLEQSADLALMNRAQGKIALARTMLAEIAAAESAAKSSQ